MKINICVLFGGNSVEHEISIISAMQAIENIDKNKYNVLPVYISKEGNFYSENNFDKISTFINIKLNELKQINFIKDKKEVFMLKSGILNLNKKKIDLFLPIVHGTNVEDGTLQGFLNTFDIPVCGPSVLSGAIGQDKSVTKDILKANGINHIKYLNFIKSDDFEEIKKIIKNNLKYPIIIKPANLGSSIGITIVNSEDDLEEKVNESFTYDSKIVVEEKLKNISEYNISFLGNNESYKYSEIEKVIKDEDFLSYSEKYEKGSKSKKNIPSKGMASLNRELPAKISDSIKNEIIKTSTKAFKALSCTGIIRFDIIIDLNNNVYINEINTIPGALSYYFWENKGIKYSELLDDLINLSIKEYFDKQKLVKTFNNNVLEGYQINDKN